MSIRPPESLKEAAKELALLLSQSGSSDDRKTLLLHQFLPSLSKSLKPTNGAVTLSPFGEQRIGIWRPVEKKGKKTYVRDTALQVEWPLWANVHEIRPKSSKKRIVLLGESVARGYFYDPHYNVAKELAATLAGTNVLRNSEVLDLARTSIGMEELLDLARSCSALEPDAVVIFAGNNWASRLTVTITRDDYKHLHEIYRQELFPGVKAFLEERFEKIVSSFLAELETYLTKKGIPVIFLIPAYNFPGWKSDAVEKTLAWLPDNRRSEWLSARDKSGSAFERGDWSQLEASARRMVTLDPSNPLGYEWLGHCYLRQKNLRDAEECLQAACDTALIGRGENSKPRCFKVIRDTILTRAARHRITVVDLQEAFRGHVVNELPDKEFFLDYCHLTIKGIKIAMQATAGALVKVLTGKPAERGEVRDSGLYPDALTRSTAHFCAAIHNAHHGQPADIVNYHCREAVVLSPEVKDTMMKYMDFSTRYASTLFCKSFEEIISEERMRQYEGGLALPHPKNGKLMDVILVGGIEYALQADGVSIAKEVTDLRMKEHGIGEQRVNLLQSFYSKTSYNGFNARAAADFFQARNTESRFYFIAEKESCLLVRIVYRTPCQSRIGSVKIGLNDQTPPVAELPATDKWANFSFSIPRNMLSKGVNELIIHWPYTYEPLKGVDNISSGSFLRSIFPVLGEIHTLTAERRLQDYPLDSNC